MYLLYSYVSDLIDKTIWSKYGIHYCKSCCKYRKLIFVSCCVIFAGLLHVQLLAAAFDEVITLFQEHDTRDPMEYHEFCEFSGLGTNSENNTCLLLCKATDQSTVKNHFVPVAMSKQTYGKYAYGIKCMNMLLLFLFLRSLYCSSSNFKEIITIMKAS